MSANPAPRSAPPRTATQDSLLLKDIFQSIDAQSCPKTYNFHMHTHCSDGRLSPEELMTQALEIGLKGLAITDHHTLKAYDRARQWMEDWQWRNPSHWGRKAKKVLPRLWTGVEITSLLAGTEVHILGYAFDSKHPIILPYLQHTAPRGEEKQAARVIAAIQAAGGLAVLAHPVRYRTAEDILIHAAADLNIDGVETYYAYDNPPVWRPSPGKTQRVMALASQRQLLSSCGTDTHGMVLTRRI
ncbi:PHP domain-containing protein [Romeria aff. gracilis LEGE 07310]|uniref:PHP domain-containing protein n=1 Tax=Vasconcelosia minhoensis LEGE 07310 TaxID=915328 RepID=A0A8J7A873_9CYAN|nr:PHP domain-containing protein [Romeria aff. gracilis LEGE 07310]